MTTSSTANSLDGLDPQRWGIPEQAVESLARHLYDCWDRFRPCFLTRTRDTSHLAHVYLKGLLLLPKDRNYANIARRVIAVDDDGQSLQHFMSDSPWHSHLVFSQIQEEIRLDGSLHGGVLSLDESGDRRAGELSAGAGRQYLGSLGKVDVGQVGVSLSYSREDLWSLIDAELYLPRNWFDDGHAKLRQRLHIPQGRTFATKPEIGLELIRRAHARRLPFTAVAADAVYGRDSAFRAALDDDKIPYVVDVPSDYPVYLERPEVGVAAGEGAGRSSSKPRILNGVESVRAAGALEKEAGWQTLQLRASERGMVEVTCAARRVWTITAKWQVREEWLVEHRQSNGKLQHSLSNAPADTPLPMIMHWRGQRYFVERTYQDSKSELGWDELVAQKYRAWMHHTALDALALWFVMSVRREWTQKYPRAGGLKEELKVPKLPALSVSNIRELLRSVLPLRQFTPEQAIHLVCRHLLGRARSTRSRHHKQEAARRAAKETAPSLGDQSPRGP